MKLVSIITASNRPHNMAGFLKNLQETVDDLSRIEVLVKIDIGDTVMHDLLEASLKEYDFDIHYIQTPKLDGYYTLHYGYQELYNMSDKSAYFIFPVNEEVRFSTKGWDTVLAKYMHFYPDDVFRLKISRLKYRNYYSFHDAGPTPENYPFATRKWFEITGGIGDCWGQDGWHQYIDYHMGQTEGLDGIKGLFRSVPIHDILIYGEEAGKELSPEQIKKRSHRIFQEWWRMYRTEAQQEFRHIATKMLAHVWAYQDGVRQVELIDNVASKQIQIRDLDTGELKQKHFNYYLSPAYIRWMNFIFLIKMARRNSIGFLTAFIYPSYGSVTGLMGWINFVKRYLLVLVATVLSFLTYADESIPKGQVTRIVIRLKQIVRFLLKRSIQKVQVISQMGLKMKEIMKKIFSRIYYPNPMK
jgi:hypothetical protein